jgi:hypothetical protein
MHASKANYFGIHTVAQEQDKIDSEETLFQMSLRLLEMQQKYHRFHQSAIIPITTGLSAGWVVLVINYYL